MVVTVAAATAALLGEESAAVVVRNITQTNTLSKTKSFLIRHQCS